MTAVPVPSSPSTVLRQAAKLMRERAGKASPSPWHVDERTHRLAALEGPHVRHTRADGLYSTAVVVSVWDNNAPHIASWHPAVALAVADWLDAEARIADIFRQDPAYPAAVDRALAVARAYLGTEPP